MAKKETKTPENGAAAPAAPSAFPAKVQNDGDRFVRVMEDGKGRGPTETVEGKVIPLKVAPQVSVILNTLEAAGEGGLTRAELVTRLNGVITTRQPIGRIVSYYQKLLIASGAATLTKVAPAS